LRCVFLLQVLCKSVSRCNGVPYVDAKVMGEQVVLQAHAAGEIESTIVRPGDVYGPRSRPWTTRPVRLIASGSLVLPLQGKGIFTPVRAFPNLTG
jgi:nucleoside-diphosphate-sugar epimerase